MKRGKKKKSFFLKKNNNKLLRSNSCIPRAWFYLGLLIEGIFRLSGAAPEVENLLLDFDKPPTYGKYIDLKHYDIHAITGVVKKYLRQLPDPVIPIACHEEFIQLYGIYYYYKKKKKKNSRV